MPIQMRAEARCDQCGKVTPCNVWLLGEKMIGLQAGSFIGSYAVATGLEGWFERLGVVVCSMECRALLERSPQFADLAGAWEACR